MFCLNRSRIPLALALLVRLMTGAAGADEPKSDGTPPVAIVVETPADFEALLKRITTPDFVIETGAQFDRRREAQASPPSASAIVESIAVRGEIIEDLAHLNIEVVASLANPGPIRLPIGLDGTTVIEIQEGEQFLPPFAGDGGWQVEVRGQGRHRLRVVALARVISGLDGIRLTLGIPQVAATSIELTIAGKVTSASAGTRQPVAIASIEGGRFSRLSAYVTPRKRLDLTWISESDARAQGSPRLTATGEIELTIDPGAVRARVTWSVDCERGTANTLDFALDPRDDLLGVELNGRPLPVVGLRDASSGVLKVPLGEPLRPRMTARVVFQTRRPLSHDGPTRLAYQGTPLVDAVSQSGVIAIAREGDLVVLCTFDRGLRQLDPLNDLRAGLRSRPTTILAYQFFSQPIELSLRIEASPPQVRVDSRSRIVVGAKRAKVETRLDYRILSGTVFRVEVDVPDSLELESAGTAEIVASSQLIPEAATDPSTPTRTLVLSLTPKAREDGAFSVVLNGQCSLGTSRSASIGLFRPRQARGRGTRVVVETPLGVEAEVVESSGFVPSSEKFDDRGAEAAGSRIWLRNDADPVTIPLRLVEIPRTLRFDSAVSARIHRRSIEVRQDLDCMVRNGTLSSIDIEVPGAESLAWDVDQPQITSRRRLSEGAGGSTRFRLKLAREATETATIRFRIRQAIGDETSRGKTVAIPSIRVVEGTEIPSSYELTADDGVEIHPEGPSWRPLDDADPTDGPPRRWSRDSSTTGHARVAIHEATFATLPSVVASRLWIRTTQAPDGSVRGTAWYRIESAGSAFAFDLPEGVSLNRAWINGEAAAEIEATAAGSYRLPLPAGSKSPASTVCLEYLIPAGRSSSHGQAPRLQGGGMVRQTFWTVRIPWNLALIGVPGGWIEENRWSWASYAWIRRPIRDDEALARWIDETKSPRLPDGIDLGGPASFHTYLFGRPGEPVSLPILVASRASLVAACSGASLLIGLALVFWRPSKSRLAMAAAVATVAIFGFFDPSVVILAIEYGAVGFVLVLFAYLTQRLVDRPRIGPGSAFAEPAGPSTPSGTSRFASLAEVGSDESTIVRATIGSTAEHIRNETPVPATRSNLPRS